MIKYYHNFLSSSECEYFIDIFNNESMNYYGNDVYKFYYIDLINRNLDTEKFSDFNFKKFRIQMVNESIQQVEDYHRHMNPWSFIIFLNEIFEGGEVIFTNHEYKPKIGDMIYFSGNEKHKVNNCVGNRYTLVGFMLNNPLTFGIQKDLI